MDLRVVRQGSWSVNMFNCPRNSSILTEIRLSFVSKYYHLSTNVQHFLLSCVARIFFPSRLLLHNLFITRDFDLVRFLIKFAACFLTHSFDRVALTWLQAAETRLKLPNRLLIAPVKLLTCLSNSYLCRFSSLRSNFRYIW